MFDLYYVEQLVFIIGNLVIVSIDSLDLITYIQMMQRPMGIRRGGQEGALVPPWPAKIVCFLTF